MIHEELTMILVFSIIFFSAWYGHVRPLNKEIDRMEKENRIADGNNIINRVLKNKVL